MPEWFDELAEFLRIQSISADPSHAADVRSAGEWVCQFLRDAGGTCELLDWHGQPLAVGELRAAGQVVARGALGREADRSVAQGGRSRQAQLAVQRHGPG